LKHLFWIFFALPVLSQMTWTDPIAIGTTASTDSRVDMDPNIETDGKGNWVAVWRSSDDLGGSIGTDDDILVSHSTDNGASWSEPMPLNTNAATDSGFDNRPQVASDGIGNWVAVWHSTENLSGGIGTDLDLFVSRSSDIGQTWTDPVPLNTTAAGDTSHDFDPEIKTDGVGVWVAVWYNTLDPGPTGDDADLLVARSIDNGGTWSAPALLNTTGTLDAGSDFLPEIDTDGLGIWVVVWYSNDNLAGAAGVDHDIFYSRSENHGLSWSSVSTLNSNAAIDTLDDTQPQLATDRMGNWIAVWYSATNLDRGVLDSDILFARSTDNGEAWSDPAYLNTNALTDVGSDIIPQIVTDGNGAWLVSWQSSDTLDDTIGNDDDILFAESTDIGVNWSDPSPLNTDAATDSGNDWLPQIAADGLGNWVAVWASSNSHGGTLGDDFDILTASSPIPCSLPTTFFDTLPMWPEGATVSDLILLVNQGCD